MGRQTSNSCFRQCHISAAVWCSFGGGSARNLALFVWRMRFKGKKLINCKLSFSINIIFVFQLWQISSEGNVFSSPQVLYPDNGRTAEILFGCHDKHLYCYSWTGKCSESPVQKWKLPLQSPIYATPCIANGLAVVCSTSGWVNLVCLLSGEIIGLLKLGGEVFSSPLVVGQNVIYVGCRDNNLYKLAFTRWNIWTIWLSVVLSHPFWCFPSGKYFI